MPIEAGDLLDDRGEEDWGGWEVGNMGVAELVVASSAIGSVINLISNSSGAEDAEEDGLIGRSGLSDA